MRKEWLVALVQQARTDKGIYLLVGDVGYGLVEPFRDEFPDRFINCGIAEQNMVGVATGLALSGKTVFVYSLSNFVTFRCLEQIRNDVCYHKANVKIVCSGGGLSYGNLGMTHHTIQDLAIMRCLPNMTVEVPSEGWAAAQATEAIAQMSGPCYLRLERDGETVLPLRNEDYTIGKASTFAHRNGSDVMLIATGGIVANALHAVRKLKAEGIKATVVDMHTIKPLDEDVIQSANRILTIEEHSIVGGLGSAVAEVLAEDGGVRFHRLGLNDCFCHEVGDQEYLRAKHHLSIDAIVSSAEGLIEE